jgi:hypothetical protein
METQEKIGTVFMKPLEALKKICEENPINRVIGVFLPKYEKLLNEKIKAKEQIPMFTQDTRNQYLGDINIVEELKSEKEGLEI